MRTMLKAWMSILIVAAAPTLVRAQGEVRPEIWEKVDDAGLKKVEDAACKDACVRLVEEVYRLPVDRNRNVYDLMLKVDQVNEALIKGLAKAPAISRKLLEDGRMEVQVVTTPKEVVAILKKAYGDVDWALAEDDSTVNSIATLTKADEKVFATGEAALPRSPGEKRLLSIRAALLKAEVELAKQLLKMRVRDRETVDEETVANFVADFPKIGAQIANGLSTTDIHAIEFAEDGSVEMTAEVKVGPVAIMIDSARRVYDTAGKYDRWYWNLAEVTKDMIFSAKASAKPTEKSPENVPLALEKQAVEKAKKELAGK